MEEFILTLPIEEQRDELLSLIMSVMRGCRTLLSSGTGQKRPGTARLWVLNAVDGGYKLGYIVAHTGGLRYGC